MKNKNNNRKPLHKIFDFLEGNLQAVLGLLLLFAFVFGYSLATSPKQAGEITPPEKPQTALRQVSTQNAADTAINFQGKSLKKITFGADGLVYGVPRQPGAVWDSTANLVTQKNYLTVSKASANKLTLTLNSSFTGILILNPAASKSGFTASINGQSKTINGPTDFNLTNASAIELTLSGFWGISSLEVRQPESNMVETPPAPASLALLPTTATIYAGQNTTLVPIALDALGTNIVNKLDLEWETNRSYIAKISSNGTVTGKGPGTATITVSIPGTKLSASASITVKSKPTIAPVAPQNPAAVSPEKSEQVPKENAPVEENKAEELTQEEVKETLKSLDQARDRQIQGDREKSASLSLKEIKKALGLPSKKKGYEVLPQEAFKAVVNTQRTFTAKVKMAVQLTVEEVFSGVQDITNAITNTVKKIGTTIWDLISGKSGAGATGELMRAEHDEGEAN